MRNVHWVLEVSITADKQHDFEAVMNNLIRETNREEGTLANEWNFNESGTKCHIYERFADGTAAMTHLTSFGDHFAEAFLNSCSVTGLTILGHASDEVVKTLEGCNPAVFHQRAGFARFQR